MKTNALKAALVLAAGLAGATPALAMDNTYYGEVRFNTLPARGKMAHKPWVGSWWAYSRDGIAHRHKTSFSECRGVDLNQAPQALVDAGKSFCLAATEKVDLLMKRVDKIEVDQVKEYQRITQEKLTPLQNQQRDVVRKLNRWIDANPGGDWRTTDDGKEYLRLDGELTTARASLPALTKDTATEFERLEHGNGVPGVGGWWGHCNAWSAASLMEEEPVRRGAVTHDGVTVEFTPGEAKALLTEGWMEHASSFFGSRHDDPERTGVTYDDLTPAAFHIYFGTQLGLQQKGFVIDRFTGDQVWNQPVRSYASRFEKLYDAAPVKTALKQTEYDRAGKGKVKELGELDVYPIQVTTTFHWITDGLPHEEATVGNILAEEWPTDHSAMVRLWGNHVEMRTLTYTLYLDKPLEDPNARIVGDGVWASAVSRDDHAWPDFAWQPLAQGPSRRNYENPLIEWDRLVIAKILPATIQPPKDVASEEFTAQDVPKDIPDNNPTGVASTLKIEKAGVIETAQIKVRISHTYIGDLRVVLEKAGQTHVLHDRAGGGDDNLDRAFDLPALKGQAAAGDWTLKAFDTAGQDVGRIEGWSVDLVLAGGEPIDDGGEQPQGGSGVFPGAGTPVAIPDNDRTGVQSAVTATGAGGNLTAIKVEVDITHTYRGDLVVTLMKDGQSYVLHNKAGGGADDLKATFEVPALVGKPAQGQYVLKVQDLARRDTGRLNGWKLDVAWK